MRPFSVTLAGDGAPETGHRAGLPRADLAGFDPMRKLKTAGSNSLPKILSKA